MKTANWEYIISASFGLHLNPPAFNFGLFLGHCATIVEVVDSVRHVWGTDVCVIQRIQGTDPSAPFKATCHHRDLSTTSRILHTCFSRFQIPHETNNLIQKQKASVRHSLLLFPTDDNPLFSICVHSIKLLEMNHITDFVLVLAILSLTSAYDNPIITKTLTVTSGVVTVSLPSVSLPGKYEFKH